MTAGKTRRTRDGDGDPLTWPGYLPSLPDTHGTHAYIERDREKGKKELPLLPQGFQSVLRWRLGVGIRLAGTFTSHNPAEKETWVHLETW